MSALVASAVVSDGDVHVVEPFYKTQRQRAAKRWGDGCALKLRIEPEEEAWRYADAKFYYGYLVKPVSDVTGETRAEVHLRWKAEFMPDDGRTSITELNRDEFKAYRESCEQDMREHTPDAWDKHIDMLLLFENRRAS